MFAASTRGGGQCFAFPDTCNTPTPAGPVPIPYPNTAECAQAAVGTAALYVKIDGQAALHTSTLIPMSSGDEAGSAGGVASGVFMQQAAFKVGSTAVFIEGKPAAMFTSTTAQNGSSANIPGTQISPSQTKVVYLR